MLEQPELNEQLEQAAGDRAADQPEQAADDLAADRREIEEADPAANQQEIQGANPAANQQGRADPVQNPLMWVVYHNKTVPPLIYNMAAAFQFVVDRGDLAVARNKNLDDNTVFHSSSYTYISMEKYLIYIYNLVDCSESCYIHAYSYLDRLAKLSLQPPITSRNAHRILLTAVGLGIKVIDGEQDSSRYFETVGRVSHSEVGEMVQALLLALEYRVHLPHDEFMSHKTFLEEYDDDDEDDDRKCCSCFSMYSCFN